MVIGIQTRNSREIPKELRVWIPITKTVTSLDSYYQFNYLVSVLPRRNENGADIAVQGDILEPENFPEKSHAIVKNRAINKERIQSGLTYWNRKGEKKAAKKVT